MNKIFKNYGEITKSMSWNTTEREKWIEIFEVIKAKILPKLTDNSFRELRENKQDKYHQIQN